MHDITSSYSCPLCREYSDNILTSSLRRGDGKVYLCKECDHGFLDSSSQLDIREYYNEEYRKEYSSNAAATETNAEELFDVYHNYQDSRLKIIRPSLKKDTELLEVGCSSGMFMVHVKEEVKLINGIELDQTCCEFVNRVLGISCDDDYLPNSKFCDIKYDIVCSFQVMEHVPDPVSFMGELINATKPFGKIFIEVPNLDDSLLKVWKNEAYQDFYYHSAHLHYFTENSLRNVASKAGVKSENIKFEFTQDYNLLNHLNWVTNHRPQKDCHVGLSKINLSDEEEDITQWLNDELLSLNKKYFQKLKDSKTTSNIMMIIDNDR